MAFRKHKIRVSSNQMVPGNVKSLFSIYATDYSNDSSTDLSSRQDQVEGAVAPGRMHMDIPGPVVIHGYSVRVWADYFGILGQGLSSRTDEFTISDKDGYTTHNIGVQHAASDGTDEVSRNHQRRDLAVKNLKYVPGYRYQPARDDLNSLLSLGGITISGEQYGVNFPKGLKLGSAHLQKKFSRDKMRYSGNGNYKKSKKSGFVLVPNTDTEFFSIFLGNKQHSQSDEDDSVDGWHFADITVWFTYDNA